jgi:tRNA (guanine-N7-)-methyltransferase
MADRPVQLDYHATSFSQGRMDFAWEELTEEDIRRAYADWEAGRGLIGGDPRRRPDSHLLPQWGLGRPFFRALALDDTHGDNGARLRGLIGSSQPLEVEIGFGRGDFLLDRAQRHPDRAYIGYETKIKAARLLLARIERAALDNLWVSDDDCRFSLPRVMPDGRLDAVHVLFPDPWWKPQHQVKRLFSPPFVDLLANKLRSGGLLHFKSDVADYGGYVRYLVEQHDAFAPHDPALAERLGPYAMTHREHWCVRHNCPVHAYFFVRR